MPVAFNLPDAGSGLREGNCKRDVVHKFKNMGYKVARLTLLIFWIGLMAGASVVANGVVRIKTDVCVIGAGSGGIGAALAAARAGAMVVLIEKQGNVGGTSTMAFVNNWEPGPGCSYSGEIYEQMNAAGAMTVSKNVHSYSGEEPYGIWVIDSTATYNQTLRRSDLKTLNSVIFDFKVFDRTVQEMLGESGRVQLLLNTSFIRAKSRHKKKKMKTVEALSSTGERYMISAKVFIDCTGGAVVCRSVGCEMMLGAEAREKFNEPSAPEKANDQLNAISLCYRIKKSKGSGQARPLQGSTFNYPVVAVMYDIPGKENLRSINPLGIMEGSELIRLGYDSAYQLAKRIVDDHWSRMRRYPHFLDYEFDRYAPMLGIRESYRVVTEYVLNQNDLLAGYKKQVQKDIIALADHPMDVHGRNTSLSTLPEAYGIPYRCLIPKGWSNLMVACRGAGFSHLAASSCRLSRTMIAIGHAAGFAAGIAVKEKVPVPEVPVQRIRAEMNLKLRPKRNLKADPRPVNKILGKNDKSFLFSDNGRGTIGMINAEGRIIWEFPVSNCQDLHILASGNILYTFYTSDGGHARGGVCEIMPDKEVVFRYETDGEVHSCVRLKNGNTLLTDNQNSRLIEVNPEGETVKVIPLQTKVKGHSAVRMIRGLDNGNYLVCQEADHLVVEYDPGGKVIRSYKSPGKCFEAIQLRNGHILISDGDACSVREITRKGKVVWKISKEDFPELKLNWVTGIEELPDGNILICNWLGHGQSGKGIPIFEVTKKKEIVWYFTDNFSTGSVSNVCLKH